jgi:valyl-tRNA synthetase
VTENRADGSAIEVDKATGQETWFICVRAADEEEVLNWLESAGFVQDPDVLDTWFSSALWPHSTLGWPEKTAELEKWNPTSVLVTARDIITLWVARMVMMNLYNMGENEWTSQSEDEAKAKISGATCEAKKFVPFFDVAINPTILDGKGERMSKSKGNGVDPVDIIDTHGADALRFTMTQMATETQDVRLPVKKLPDGRNTSDKFDVGRNFCNKLWNASRFALSNLESINNQPSTAIQLSLADKWILSRLARTVAEANDAIANYRFDQYARACYQFFWNDFCDWYVEIVKPIFKTPEKAGTTAAVLAAALDQSLRLMHPMIPFITETIWWRLNEVRPSRSIANLVDAPASPLLIHASWPKIAARLIDEQVEREFALMQETIVSIRNVRNEHKVDVKKVVTVSISPADAATQAVLQANDTTIQLLATCTIKTIASGLSAPAGAVRTMVGANEIYVEGMVDADAEKARVAKREEELTKLIASLEGRMANAGYVAKAPPRLIEETKKQLAEAKAELSKLRQ